MTHAMSLTDVTKRFGGVAAVDRLTLSVPTGSIYGFIGPNGSGKTTTLRMIMHILLPDEGRIEVLGSTDTAAARDQAPLCLDHEVGLVLDQAAVRAEHEVDRALDLFGRIEAAGELARGKRDQLPQRGQILGGRQPDGEHASLVTARSPARTRGSR